MTWNCTRNGTRSIEKSPIGYLIRVLVLLLLTIGAANAQPATIVGTGAVICTTFLSDIAKTPLSEREYFSWTQGYMSGILRRAPPGKDEHLRLVPAEFPIQEQLLFVRDFCFTHPNSDYSDAAENLYLRLRAFTK